MEINELMEEAKRRLEKVGVYTQASTLTVGQVAPDDATGDTDQADKETPTVSSILDDPALKQKMIDGNVKLAFYTVATVNDLAFSDRIQDPKRFDEKKQFEEIVPTAAEMSYDAIKDTLKGDREAILAAFMDEDDDDQTDPGT